LAEHCRGFGKGLGFGFRPIHTTQGLGQLFNENGWASKFKPKPKAAFRFCKKPFSKRALQGGPYPVQFSPVGGEGLIPSGWSSESLVDSPIVLVTQSSGPGFASVSMVGSPILVGVVGLVSLGFAVSASQSLSTTVGLGV
jgi:hypothetical protein